METTRVLHRKGPASCWQDDGDEGRQMKALCGWVSRSGMTITLLHTSLRINGIQYYVAFVTNLMSQFIRLA